MSSRPQHHPPGDVSFLRPWVNYPTKLIEGYVDRETGYEGCKIKFFRKSGWTKEKHGAKSYWVVEGHTAEGVFTRKAWADAIMNEPTVRGGGNRKITTYGSFEEAHHYLASLCFANHTACKTHNGSRVLGPYVPTEEGIAASALKGDTGLTQEEIDEQSDGEPWRKGLSLLDCIALGVEYVPDDDEDE
ncbi:hypothetical protein B0H16DRAFT_1730983 [Mycena metata]|uniref:Uncharacterized protein n=1 Tax=Mycena metata TaxID=1033252 RepID=A0AAD7I7R1_9AGAR|nr:hypothetical protein B0H16DRAFT_1730983 [Mycena metata]